MNILHIFEKCHISSVLGLTFSFSICVPLITDDALMESESRTAADKTDVPAVPSGCQPQQNVPTAAMTASIPQDSDGKLYPELLHATGVLPVAWPMSLLLQPDCVSLHSPIESGYLSLGICTSECMK